VAPKIDVREDAASITIAAELPGVAVTLSNGILTIKGEKKQNKEQKTETNFLAERSYGAFKRFL
jgi:HSP20 family protein